MRILIIIFTICSFSLHSLAQHPNQKTDTLTVSGACEQCKGRIESALKHPKIYTANWDVESNLLTVAYDSSKFSVSDISQRVAAVGHDTRSHLASDRVYRKLPDCCLYERVLKPEYKPDHATVKVHGTESGESHHDDENQADSVVTDHLQGAIFIQDESGRLSPLQGATVFSNAANRSAVTNEQGVYEIHGHTGGNITISHVGYKTETVAISPGMGMDITLKRNAENNIQEVVVTARKFSSFINTKSTTNTLNIGIRELKKAACCNLSESFETTPSVDVSYSDAVTGIRQIQLLGLAGPYTQITTENTPEIKGLSSIYGLTFTPGPWITGIEITKGAGSVVNGYESIAGQINVERVKPETAPKLYVNGYANNQGRLETSVNFAKRLNAKWSTALLTHANASVRAMDENNDNFLDMPKGNQLNVINRWQYGHESGLFAQLDVRALKDSRQSGEVGFNEKADKLTTNKYGVGIEAEQYGVNGKLGYVFPEKDYKSFGFIFSANRYTNDSYFGLNRYTGRQDALYGNFIYQSQIGSHRHRFKAGAGIINDYVAEQVNNVLYARTETVPGIFGEYTFKPVEKFTAIAGLRTDFHAAYGTRLTPRLHLKYDVNNNINLRLSGGSGFRTANIFAENTGLFVSSRQWKLTGNEAAFGYGFRPEKAWNFGANAVAKFKINQRQGTFSLDAYRTTFKNQVVVDVDASPSEIQVYDLEGKSFSNTMQAELNYALIPKLDIRLAYRWLDVQTDYETGRLEKPLVSKHRAFANLGYATNNDWKFDYTVQWLGRKRLPHLQSNPVEYRMDAYSPSYTMMSAQVTKQIGGKWDVYLGSENLTNFKQKKMILSANDPFSPYFDGSIVWAPANGRMVYAGFRYTLK